MTPSNSANCTLIAFRVRSRSCALSARFFPPSMPAEVTANARCTKDGSTHSYYMSGKHHTLSSSLTLFRLSMDALRVRISFDFNSNCCLRSATSLMFASRLAAYCISSLVCAIDYIQWTRSFSKHVWLTLNSAMESTMSALLVSSSWMVFSVHKGVVRFGHPECFTTHQEAPHNQLPVIGTEPRVRLCGE